MSAPAARPRAWLAAAAGVALAAAAARVHNAFAYPPLHDFDGPGHGLNVFACWEGRLPDPASWSGFHPPLYYALGAALWRVLPESVPVHAALRLLSAAAGFGAVALAWRALTPVVGRADAAVAAALALGAPVVAIATSMLGNETTCAFFATAVLARLAALPEAHAAPARHALATGGLAALAALSKSTGVLAVGVAAAAYAWRARPDAGAMARAAAAALALPALVLAPLYAWTLAATGSPLGVISGGTRSDAAGSEMAAQPPGERHLADYVAFPPAALLAPLKDAPGMIRSVPGLLYASTWADGHGQFLPAGSPRVVAAAAAMACAGLVPTALAAAGTLALLRGRRRHAGLGWPALFAAALAAAFLAQTWLVPTYSAVKASYLLSALFPALAALAIGLGCARGAARAALRALLLAIAAGGVALTWWGWWA